MIANSPDFAAWVPRLFSSTTSGGNQVNGASRSSPALVRKISFRCGAGHGNSALITLASVTSASASRIAGDEISRRDADTDVVPRADIRCPSRRCLPHRAGEIEQGIVVWVLQMNAHVPKRAIATNAVAMAFC